MTTKNSSQDAFSLIEILIAITLISLLLTGLSMTLLYSNRAIKDTQYRSQATDQARSCMDVFRNLRDSNSWTFFCQRLTTVELSPDGTKIQAHLGDDGTDIKDLCTVPPASLNNESEGDNHFEFPTDVKGINSCKDQNARIDITIKYTNFHGDLQTLTMNQDFKKRDTEAEY